MGALRFWTTILNSRPRDEENYAQRGRTGGLVNERANVLARDMLFRFLDTNGDGTGTKNAIGDLSSTPVFLITAPAGYEYILNRMIVKIEDAASGFNADTYGGLTALTNGILLGHYNSSGAQDLDLLDGEPIKQNLNWARNCFDATIESFGSGTDFFKVRWTFANAGNPLVLEPGESLRLTIQDDLTGLIGQFFQVQGWRRQV